MSFISFEGRPGILLSLVLVCVLAFTFPAKAGFTVPGGVLFNHSGYNYAPSMFQDGNIQKFWWCGYDPNIPGTGKPGDVIYYTSVDLSTQTWSATQEVLRPTAGSWDSAFTCDPSVIVGSFTVPGIGGPYSYAMYYGATDRADGTNNRVGVAFSNDGINWVKYGGNPVFFPQTYPTSGYGAGQPATYSYNHTSGLRVLYTDSTYNGVGAVLLRSTSDGINFSNPTPISNQPFGFSMNNCDFGYDYNTGLWYAAIPDRTRPGDREHFSMTLYSLPDSQLESGQGVWQQLGTIDTNLTGYYLNHSPGLLRDKYGEVTPWLPMVEVYFAEGTNVTTTWQLTWVSWNPQPSSLPFNRYDSSSLNLHWVTTGYVPGGYHNEETLGYLLMAPQAGMSAVYGCHVTTGGSYQFVSTDSNCEGQVVNGLNGYLYASPPGGISTQALYRCRAGADHFVSPYANCEGQVTEYLLGYAKTQQ